MVKIITLLLSILFSGCYEDVVEPESAPKLNYPVNLSWESVDLNNDGIKENYVTSIKKQRCGDCFIYAAIGLLEIQYQIDHQIQINLDLSEQSLHNCLRIQCNMGGDDRDILNYLQSFGVVEEQYDMTGFWGACNSCPIFTNNIVVEPMTFFYLGGWKQITNVKMSAETRRLNIVEALQTGPITLEVESWSGLGLDGNTLYCIKKDISGHIIIVVGYESYGKVLIIKNSYGESGTLKLLFEDVEICGIGAISNQIVPFSTYSLPQKESKFCHSTQDSDMDGISDPEDNCPFDFNKDQKNTDNDLFGDICDIWPNDISNSFYCNHNYNIEGY